MTPGTLDAVLRARAGRAPDAIALRTEGATRTYGELAADAERLAGGLRSLGVARGDRVVVALPNGLDAVRALLATFAAGAVVVPAAPALPAAKLDGLIAHSDAAALITTPAIAARDADRRHPDGPALVVAGAVGEAPGTVALSALADAAAPLGAGPDADDLAAIVYTSGSTGQPKGVMLSHANLTFVNGSIVQYLELEATDRVLSVLPLSFGYGLSQLLTCVHAGARLVLEPGLRFPGRLVKLLAAEQITGLPGVPTIFHVLAGLPGLAERPSEHLRFLTNAGAALPAPTAAALRRCFPHSRLYAMYGQTECTRISYLPPEHFDAHPGSVGVAIPRTTVRVVDEQGAEVGAGEIGELVVAGPHVMQGYWRDPAASAERLLESPDPASRALRTKDLFRRDAGGLLHFVSRTDDIIKSRGEKIAPREIEEALLAIPGVAEAVVVGVPDPLLGEAIEAHVAPADGVELEERALRRGCAERLVLALVPRRITVHPELPKSLNGKLDRLALTGARTSDGTPP